MPPPREVRREPVSRTVKKHFSERCDHLRSPAFGPDDSGRSESMGQAISGVDVDRVVASLYGVSELGEG